MQTLTELPPGVEARLESMAGCLPRPYSTIAQASQYLQVSPETIARMLVPAEQPRGEGQIRFRRIEGRKSIRVLTSDVYAVLPPEEEG